MRYFSAAKILGLLLAIVRILSDAARKKTVSFAPTAALNCPKFKQAQMKKLLPLALSLFFILPVFFWSCTNTDKPDRSAILRQPPFAALTDSINSEPENPRFYLGRAILLSQNKLHDLASPDYKKAWELTKDEGVALEYASNLLLVNQVKEAVALLKACKEKFPDNPEFGRRLSEVYVQTNQREAALAEYNELLSKDSLNFMAWFEKGQLLSRLKDTPAAIMALERSYAIQPINYTGLALANIYSLQKNPRVLIICDNILNRDSTGDVIDALFIKGMYYADTKDYQKAIGHFDLCIDLDWKFIHAYLEKGIIYFEQEKFPDALAIFKKATVVSNTNPDAYFWVGRCYEAQNDKELARENYQRTLSLDPEFEEAKAGIKRLGK